MVIEPENIQDEFQDPLENYDPRTYDDPIQQALAEQTVDAIQSRPFASVSPETPVAEAVQKLAGLHVACLLVVDEQQLVGVFTDRNVLDKVALEMSDVADHEVREVMTPHPVVVYESDPAAAALAVMAVSGYRHVPVLDGEEHVLGVISPQRVTGFLKKHFDEVRDA